MTIPHLPQVRIALWEQLESARGLGESQDIIEALVERFLITPAEREQRDPSGQKTFDHRVHSAIAQSRKIGWIESVEEAGRGLWKLTSAYYEDNPQEEQAKEEKNVVGFFRFGQPLGHPSVFPPVVRGKIGASVQFIIPGLKVSKDVDKFITQFSGKCGMDLWGFDTKPVVSKDKKRHGTLVTLAFHIVSTNNEEENNRLISYNARLLVERLLGLLSFFAGTKLHFIYLQTTVAAKEKGQFQKTMSPAVRGDMPPVKTEFSIPDIDSIDLPEIVFSALLWLRRGLAQERDPIETFSSLMVCLQIMARYIESEEATVTSQMRKLIVSRLGRSLDIFGRIWKTRNAIVAHGNEPVTPDVLLELTELKFEAAVLAYQSIKLSLGMPLDSPPLPDQSFFMTDCFMYWD